MRMLQSPVWCERSVRMPLGSELVGLLLEWCPVIIDKRDFDW